MPEAVPSNRWARIAAFLLRHRDPLCLFVAALAVRLHWNLEVHPLGDYVYSDMRGYVRRAELLVRDPLGRHPYQAFYPPGTHVWLALLQVVFGDGDGMAAAVSYALFGALVAPAIHGIGVRMTGRREVGLVTGALVVPYYPLVALGGYLLSEPPFVLAMLVATRAALRLAAHGRNRDAAFLGGMLGVGAWFRPQVLAVLPVWGILWLGQGRRSTPVGPSQLGLAGLTLASALAVSAAHVYHHTGRLGLVSENGSFNRIFGACHATKVVALPAEPGQVRTGFSPPSLLQLARRARLPGKPFPQLEPAGEVHIEYRGYVGDRRIHERIIAGCVERTGLAGQVRHAAAHWALLFDHNVMWPDSGRRTFLRAARWWGERTRWVLLLGAVLAALAPVAALVRGRYLAAGVVGAHVWGLFAVAARYFGSIRLRVPYDPFLLLFVVAAAFWGIRRLVAVSRRRVGVAQVARIVARPTREAGT